MKATVCAETRPETQVALKDARDDKYYLVRKTADQRCWMIQNLAVEPNVTLTSSYSDVNSNFKMPSNGTWDGFTDTTTSYMKTGAHTNAVASSYGHYYKFVTAAAGTQITSLGYGESATKSICPKNWRLPIIGNNPLTESSEPYKLFRSYGFANGTATNYTKINASFPLTTAGRYRLNSSLNNGSCGYWFSSTRRSASYSDEANVTSPFTFLSCPNTNGHQVLAVYSQAGDHGLSVRCIAYN